jgi:hypothetical protein
MCNLQFLMEESRNRLHHADVEVALNRAKWDEWHTRVAVEWA